jgi:CxxC motif-containing protein
MKHEYTCIVCPRGCRLQVEHVDDHIEVSGAGCRRGERFAREEVTDPRRNLTTTVQTTCEAVPRLPVRTDRPISKTLLLDASARLASVTVEPPVRRGEIIVRNIMGSGANVVVSADIRKEEDGEAL